MVLLSTNAQCTLSGEVASTTKSIVALVTLTCDDLKGMNLNASNSALTMVWALMPPSLMWILSVSGISSKILVVKPSTLIKVML